MLRIVLGTENKVVHKMGQNIYPHENNFLLEEKQIKQGA